jgi:hypothetical protein
VGDNYLPTLTGPSPSNAESCRKTLIQSRRPWKRAVGLKSSGRNCGR